MNTDSRDLRISMLQCDILTGEPERNFRKVQDMIEAAVSAEDKPDLILLPELWNTGYAQASLMKLAERGEDGFRREMSRLAAEHAVQIAAGSLAEVREGRLYNTMYVYDRNGTELSAYSKIHLFGLMDEDKYMAPGNSLSLYELEDTKCGSAICYDIRFPELTRSLALSGAELLLVPAQWPHPRLHHWRSLLIARAIENQMYIAACNRAGSSGTETFCGHSLLIDPWGEVIAEGTDREEIVTGLLDLSLVGRVREQIPVFRDRRPETYAL